MGIRFDRGIFWELVSADLTPELIREMPTKDLEWLYSAAMDAIKSEYEVGKDLARVIRVELDRRR